MWGVVAETVFNVVAFFAYRCVCVFVDVVRRYIYNDAGGVLDVKRITISSEENTEERQEN